MNYDFAVMLYGRSMVYTYMRVLPVLYSLFIEVSITTICTFLSNFHINYEKFQRKLLSLNRISFPFKILRLN